MKKAIVLAVMGLALVSAAGCSGSKEENKLEWLPARISPPMSFRM